VFVAIDDYHVVQEVKDYLHDKAIDLVSIANPDRAGHLQSRFN
jgi:hypothetical protein